MNLTFLYTEYFSLKGALEEREERLEKLYERPLTADTAKYGMYLNRNLASLLI